MDGHTASYRLHLRNADGRGATSGPCLGYWCLVPGICMRELQAMGVRSIVLTSGTLSPMESFAHELARVCWHCLHASSRVVLVMI